MKFQHELIIVVLNEGYTDNVMDAARMLAQKGISATVLRLLTVEPIPAADILNEMSSRRHVVVVEEVCAESGICQSLAWQLTRMDPAIKVDGIDLGRGYVTHGNVQTLYHHYGLDSTAIADYVQEVLQNEN